MSFEPGTDQLLAEFLQEMLVKIAKKLKKNNVAVDIVSLAAEEENAPKLEAFQVLFSTTVTHLHSITQHKGEVLQ